MSIISLVVAVDEAQGIGKENTLLCHLPADLQHFKSVTMGKPIIMGRKTYESIGKALPGRLNIVVSKNPIENEGIEWAHSIENALARASEYPEIMVIGGAQLYLQTINIASRIYMTRIHHIFSADTYFPEIDSTRWSCIEKVSRSRDDKNRYDLTFMIYEKI